jgi:hypothetical protein
MKEWMYGFDPVEVRKVLSGEYPPSRLEFAFTGDDAPGGFMFWQDAYDSVILPAPARARLEEMLAEYKEYSA